MKVAQIWRYPVKSMAGEQMNHARIGPLGIEETALFMWKTHRVNSSRPERTIGFSATRPGSMSPASLWLAACCGAISRSAQMLRTSWGLAPGSFAMSPAIALTCCLCWWQRMERSHHSDVMAGASGLT